MVPQVIPRFADLSDKQYQRALGYADGENEEAYLGRLAVYAGLYGALFMCPLEGNPFAWDMAWRWLVDVLNLDPQVNVSATAITSFLHVVREKMRQIYGRQFSKLLIGADAYLIKLRRADAPICVENLGECLKG